MVLIVTYDISSHRRRAKLHTLLLAYGRPVQESVFECELTPRQERQLRLRIGKLAKTNADNVRFYRLCAECTETISDLRGLRLAPADAIVV